MRKDLSIDDLDGLVDRPLVATLATYRKDGSVLLSPVWFEWRDGGFSVTTATDDVKARHLRRDPRVSIVVYEHEPPYRGLELRATARLQTEGLEETRVRIAVKYLGEHKGREYAGTIEGDEVIIRLEPGELRTWDFKDEYLLG